MRGQQSASGAAGLVILMGLFIILYILFLPPADREALIGSATSNTTDPTIVDPIDRILDESPGLLVPQRETSETRNLNSFTLLARGEFTPVFSSGEAQIFTSRYDRRVLERTFMMDAVPTEARMSISFREVSGAIRVYVNNQEVYSGRPMSRSNKQILNLPIAHGINTIRIESSERWWFWGSNSADIESVQVIANVYSPQTARSEQTFSLPEQNRQHLERASLRFLLSCDSSRQQMAIRLNDQILGSTVYDCESPQELELPLNRLTDMNTISFEASQGVVSVQSPTIRLLYERAVDPLYYFRLTDEQWEDVRDGTKEARLYFSFVRDSEEQDLIADVNGNFISVRLDREEYEFAQDVSSFIERGENYLRLEARRAARIVKVQVFLVAKK
jgi:hypothetical protein